MMLKRIFDYRLFIILIWFSYQPVIHAQLHSVPSCGTSYNLSWDNTPVAVNEFDWTPDGSLSNTLINVGNSGVHLTISYTGNTGTLANWNGIPGPNTPGIGSNASGGTQEVLEYFTTGFNSTGITITISFSRPITEIGFDLFHINGAGPNGDQYTITATNTLSTTIFPTFTSSTTPSYTTNNFTGVIDSDNNSTAGDNDRVGINFSDINGINSITLVWDECSACTAGTAHGSAIGNMDFCATSITQPPFAKNDSATTTTNMAVTIDNLANDNDPNNNIDATSVTIISGGAPSNGSVSINPTSGEITYTPDSGYNGNDTLQYRVCDTTSPTPLCDTASVFIRIIPDFDGDGIVDSLDIDDDNDGIYDTQELCGTDPVQTSSYNGTINVFIDLDRDEGETTWTLTGPSGVIASGGPYADADDIIDNDYVITEVGTYTFTINDSFGDGITYNSGSDENLASSYSISLNGTTEYASDPSPNFGSSSDHQIIISSQQDLFSCFTADPSGDEDSDGIPNFRDPDFCTLNSNGVCANMDADNDGIINNLDLDTDNDGIPDIIEAQGIDLDGDGRVDSFTDQDGDGLTDTYDPIIPISTVISTTGDCSGTTTNYVHSVSLASGTTDISTDASLTFCMTGDYGTPANTENIAVAGEGATAIGTFDKDDSDNTSYTDCSTTEFCITTTISQANWNLWNDDGSINLTFTAGAGVNFCTDYSCLGSVSLSYPDTNTTNTAIPYPDTDNDNLPDGLDLDADNDGIGDLIEAGGIDSNGDGFVDNLTDNDGDGFSDVYDPDDDGVSGIDSGESTAPLVKTNGSGNPVNGNTAASLDSDNDGLPDHLDLDADNDGIPDLVEAGGIDTDGNGRVDNSSDADKDGYADIYDSDDDGTTGIDDANDPLMISSGDSNGNGHADDSSNTYTNGNAESADFDGDGLPDHLDLDADNDGIPDIVEAGAADPDNDGMVDTGALPWDADNDGLADVYDEDAADGPGSAGVNGTALIETSADTNGDGIVNNSESMTAGGSNNINVDGSGNPNHLDLDADDDGITDVIENASGDPDADNGGSGSLSGTVNNYTDSGNNDGWHDSSNSTTLDSDGDNIPDYLDIDADNDGIPDYKEGVCSTCPSAGGPSGGDSNGDGVLDIYNLSNDNSAAGSNIGATPHLDDDDLADTTPDYLDTDTDEDGAMDWSEGYDANDNGSALDDITAMAATFNVTHPGSYTSTDTDSDGVADWLDNLAGPGINENLRPPFLNPASGFWIDADQDGLVDIFDNSQGGTDAPTPDNNTANDLDWRDQVVQAFLPVELISFEGVPEGCAVRITWIAETEENFDYYLLEWSENGQNFEALEQIEGQGNQGRGAYQFSDAKASATNFYRLKMVDLDGTFEYSEVIMVKTDCGNEKEISVFPNPQLQDARYINLKWYSSKEEEIIAIMDQSGRVLRRMTLAVERNWNTLRLDISDLPAGMYFVKMEGNRKPQSFIIQQ